MKVEEGASNKYYLLPTNITHIKNEEDLKSALEGKIGFLLKDSIVTVEGFDHTVGNWIFVEIIKLDYPR